MMSRSPRSKVYTVRELVDVLGRERAQGRKVVLSHGVFDVVHPGHIRHLEAAKHAGDVLVVTVTPDEYVNKGPGRPVFGQRIRAEMIAALEQVDYVAVGEWPTATETIKLLQPSVYVKGIDCDQRDTDIAGNIFEEERAVESVGGSIHFTDEITFSSSALINRHFAPFSPEAREFLADFKKRHDANSVIEEFKRARDLKVLILGDTIIDEYHYCQGMGKSAKDNIIAMRMVSEERFAGGVLAAANHLAGFVSDVTLLTCLGTSNDYGEFVRGKIASNVTPVLFEQEGVPTVVKRRFLDPTFLQKLFEIAYLAEAGFLSRATERRIGNWLEEHLDEFDAVLVTDFGHGMITPRMQKLLCRKAKFLALNVQSNSANLGFNLVTKYLRADYICIDEPEVRLACHDRVSSVERLAGQIARKLKCDQVVVTRGHRGSMAYTRGGVITGAPVLSTEVVDRIGAGDAFFAATAPCARLGMAPDVIGLIGNAVGAMQVMIVGNRNAVDPPQLLKYIATLLK